MRKTEGAQAVAFHPRRNIKRGIVAVLACGTALAISTPAFAGPTDVGAFTQYEQAAAAAASSIAADALVTNDNLTCSAPTAGGSEVNPRVQYVVGEVYGNDAVFGEWDCESRAVGSISMSGTITDMAFFGGGYHGVASGADARVLSGACAVAPKALGSFGGGSGALNTWHYARFEGRTSTGRHVFAVSTLFYVASN